MPYETIVYDRVAQSGFDAYSFVITGGKMSAMHERTLYDFGWKLNDFITSGGHVLFLAAEDLPWLSDTSSGTNAIPAPIAFAKTPEYSPIGDNKLMLHSDPVWELPEKLSADMFLPREPEEPEDPELPETAAVDSLLAATDSLTIQPDDALVVMDSLVVEEPEEEEIEIMLDDIASHIPVFWSDSWKVLASIPAQFPLDNTDNFGPRKRIRVKHPVSRDFLTLFLPRKIGNMSYRFHVENSGPGQIELADPLRRWEIRTGGAAWTDANLSVKIDSVGVKTLYALDCTYVTIGEETIRSLDPMTFIYSEATDSGIIRTVTNNSISTSRHELKPYAGEIAFSGLFGNLIINRSCYLSSIVVSDSEGLPVAEADVHNESSYIGMSNARGLLPLRWENSPPTVRVHSRGRETLINLVPGRVDAILEAR